VEESFGGRELSRSKRKEDVEKVKSRLRELRRRGTARRNLLEEHPNKRTAKNTAEENCRRELQKRTAEEDCIGEPQERSAGGNCGGEVQKRTAEGHCRRGPEKL
jgi:hypothetical protein